MIRYCHDTRTLQPGEYYVAVRGERYDGHSFVAEALRKGAAGLVIEHDIHGVELPPHVDVVRVDDTVEYLGREATRRIQALGCNVVAITGSVGKTTTKRAIVTVLEQAFPVVTPQGNWNTVLGLALTVLNELTRSDQIFVAEMGMYYLGEIARLCHFFPPTVGVVTNVQAVHLETVGTIENVAVAKGELVEALRPTGVACLNYDDGRVRAMTSRCRGRVLFYGTDPAADIRPERITVDVPLLGAYRTQTALAALSVGVCLGMSDEAMNAGLMQLAPEKGRLVRLPGVAGTTLIDDTYNASQLSSMAALEVLRDHPARRRVVFLGDMLELGSAEEEAHRVVLDYALSVADLVVLVGPRMTRADQNREPRTANHEPRTANHEPRTTNQAARVVTFPDWQAAAETLRNDSVYAPVAGDVVLFKGSAGMRLEKLLRLFLSAEVDARAVLVRQEASWG